jgi:hypothetical protein
MTRHQVTALLAAAFFCTTTHAQLRRPKAELTAFAGSGSVHAGAGTRVSLSVVLPPGLHVQSDKPRDPALIPTALTVTPPSGITIDEIVYPPAVDFRLSGLSQPLAVFGERFTIDVRLTVAPALAEGDVTVPARLRYQACDASSCFPPASETAQWTLHVTGRTP